MKRFFLCTLFLSLFIASSAGAAPRGKTSSQAELNSLRHQAKAAGRANNSPAARKRLAITYVKQAATAYARGDYRRTVALCDIAADWYPTYARAHVWRGAAYQKMRNYTEARLAYKWARSLAPNSPDAARATRGLQEIGFR